MYKRILVGIDGSEDSLRAAQRVSEIAKSRTKVILFHAVELGLTEKIPPIVAPVPGGGAYVPPTSPEEVKTFKVHKGNELLKNVKEKFFKGTLSPVELRLIEDEEPKEYIDRIVKEEKIDLVTIGCKGEHSKLKRILMGTVATHVLNEVDSDVLIVR